MEIMRQTLRSTCDWIATVRRETRCNFKNTRVRCATFATGDLFDTRISMKPFFDIANTTALRPTRRGPAACGLLHDECGKGFIPHD